MSATSPPSLSDASHEPLALAMQKVLQGIQTLERSCWRLTDLARVHVPEPDPDPEELIYSHKKWADLMAALEAMSGACSKLTNATHRAAKRWLPPHDQAALARMASTPAQEAELRERIAQLDRNLMGLYPQLLALSEQAAAPLKREWNAPQVERPMHEASIRVELEYTLDASDPYYDENDDNTLAVQELLSWCSGIEMHDAESKNMRIHDNWLDSPHPWMAHQCWLTHDVLEHNYGHNPRLGLPALLRTGHIYVDVHAVRSYVFDLQTGQFVTRVTP